ncbi:MAG: N-acetylglucosamine-6-phosphate deacetylase [Oscillospiraceae bacterium]|jgi:N-acetylglucosamine-6-phosphate deacetylase|nr:N-acetylglucosamine-6-phosphate deacetylase [Oscillospiraceae bacterium]
MKIINGNVYIDKGFERLELSFGKTIKSAAKVLPPDESFDAAGMYVVPGFIDTHIHGFGGVDTMDGADAVRTMSRELVKHGTTAFLPTTMTASVADTRAALKGIAEVMKEKPQGAAVLGAYMEGPCFAANKRGAQPIEHLQLPAIELYDEITDGLDEAVRRFAIAPELDGALPLVRELVRRRVQVSIGHTDATYEQAMAAVEQGASSVTHMYNAMTPLTHRNPGAVGAALSSKHIVCEFIADLIHLHPAAIRTMFAAKGEDLCCAVTDSMMAGGMPDGEYALGGQKVYVRENAARLADGTLAGSVLTLHRSLVNMVSVVGVPLAQALPMYTEVPANLIDDEDRGRIEVGCAADIVLLDTFLNIKAVFVGGKRMV